MNCSKFYFSPITIRSLGTPITNDHLPITNHKPLITHNQFPFPPFSLYSLWQTFINLKNPTHEKNLHHASSCCPSVYFERTVFCSGTAYGCYLQRYVQRISNSISNGAGAFSLLMDARQH